VYESRRAPAPKQKIAFVVDDEHAIATTLATILNYADYDARAMFSGEEAVDASDNLQPDLLITDVVMTGMNGIEVAIIIRSKLPKCKILLFSGQAVSLDLLLIAHLEGHEFEILAKPIHPIDLLEKIRSQP
jgi:CheY-like chemotaxis protein